MVDGNIINVTGKAAMHGIDSWMDAEIEKSLHWYAVYTKSRHEKQIQMHFQRRSIESFLPLYETTRRWKGRKTQVQLPLFPGYVFVRLALTDRLAVLQVPGVVRMVGFNGQATALQDQEIDVLQNGLSQGVCALPHPYLTRGRRVRIKVGAMAGLEGILTRRKGDVRVVLSIEMLRRSISVDADVSDLEFLSDGRAPSNQSRVQCVSH